MTINVGSTGVDVFFVISGFLITLLLARERSNFGTISLRKFYTRRALRIVPAYAVYVGVVGLFLAWAGLPLPASAWFRIGTYTVSLFPMPSWCVAHLWSLSVEEHFYLIWPIAFVCMSRQSLFVICVGYSFAAVILRYLLTRVVLLQADINFFTLTRVDAIAVGCVLGLLSTSRYRYRLYVGKTTAMTLSACAVAALFVSAVLPTISTINQSRLVIFFSNFGMRFVVEWSCAVLVWFAAYHHSSNVWRWLNWNGLTMIGMLSYSLYLWQQPFTGPNQPNAVFQVPFNVLAITAAAVTSYTIVERPFRALKCGFNRAKVL